jgi:2-oxoglutarate dehydrogenase complex dehydrogenase (E1) component-like enzyme
MEGGMTKATYAGLTGAEFMRIVGADLDKWLDAAMESAAANGITVEREWLRSLLADAMDAARRLSKPVVPVTEDDNP